MKSRKQYSAVFKVKAVLEMLKEDRTVAEIASDLSVHPTMLHAWRREFEGKAASIFEDKRKRSEPAGFEKLNEHLYKQIGQLKVENDFCPDGLLRDKGCLRHVQPETRKGAVRMETGNVSIRRRCELLSLSRSGLYYAKQPENKERLAIMEAIDRKYTEDPCYGILRMTAHLNQEGFQVNHKRVRRLMRLMGLMAIYRKPRSSQRNPQHTVYPYLLRNKSIEHPNQVWATDITYIPMSHGFVYLVAILDWHTRYVLSWRISTSLDTGFCVEALNEALETYGPPEISNTDQGSQFTSQAWIKPLQAVGVQISMDGKGRYLDNIFVERFWRTLKYEDIYLKRYESLRELKTGLSQYIRYYNESRLHQALGYQTPQQVYSTRVEKPFKTLRSLEQLSNTKNDDDVMVLDPCVA